METTKNKKMTNKEKLRLRNSPALFEFYQSLTALDVVLVRYVQRGRILKEEAGETLEDVESCMTPKEIEARAAEAAKACQMLIRQFGGGCTPPSTWDEATGTCG